jgi:hypothetical protein
MGKKLTIEEVKEKIKKIHGNEVKLVESSYINMKTKCKFIDENYGIFEEHPDNVINKKTKCMKRFVQSQKTPIEEIKNKIFKIHGDIITIDESTYINILTKSRFVDKDYGEWWTAPNNVINKKCSHPKRGMLKNAIKQRFAIEKVKENLFKVHGDIVILDESTYVNMQTKCRFIDKDYGAWWATPNNIIYWKKGHKLRGYLKQIKSSNNITLKYNWETGEEVICKASYESKVVDRWNKEKERFRWQIPFENKEEKYTYFIDAYLPDKDIYVEIKGYFRKDALEKWEWFHKEHPNSELWDKVKLKELNIL